MGSTPIPSVSLFFPFKGMSMYRLENWSYVIAQGGRKRSGLCGQVHDHPVFEDGKEIVTTPPEDYLDDDVFVTHSGSKYQLGEINPEYGEMYPNAKDRIIATVRSRKEKKARHETMHAGDDVLPFLDNDDELDIDAILNADNDPDSSIEDIKIDLTDDEIDDMIKDD